MSNKKFGAILLAVAIVIIAGFGVYKLTSQEDAKVATSSSKNTQGTTSTSRVNRQTTTLALAEVQKHNSEKDCWTIISGKVYDITEYISRHPGGDEILRACGADATTLFTSRTTQDGQTVGSGTSHSGNAENQLDKFLLGDLQK